jgi:hypothetical protein
MQGSCWWRYAAMVSAEGMEGQPSWTIAGSPSLLGVLSVVVVLCGVAASALSTRANDSPAAATVCLLTVFARCWECCGSVGVVLKVPQITLVANTVTMHTALGLSKVPHSRSPGMWAVGARGADGALRCPGAGAGCAG